MGYLFKGLDKSKMTLHLYQWQGTMHVLLLACNYSCIQFLFLYVMSESITCISVTVGQFAIYSSPYTWIPKRDIISSTKVYVTNPTEKETVAISSAVDIISQMFSGYIHTKTAVTVHRISDWPIRKPTHETRLWHAYAHIKMWAGTGWEKCSHNCKLHTRVTDLIIGFLKS